MTLQDIVLHYNMELSLGEGVALWRVRPESVNSIEDSPELYGLHSVLFVIEGILSIQVEEKTFVLQRNHFADISTMYHQNYKLLHASDDLYAYHLVMTPDYVVKMLGNKPLLPFDYLLTLKEYPMLQIECTKVHVLVRNLMNIKMAFENESHRFKSLMLRQYILIFIVDAVSSFCSLPQEEKEMERANGKRELYMKFLEMLAMEINRKCSVEFFASKLCVTSQYLQRVVSLFSGKTVHDWIKESIMKRIIMLLGDTDMTLQQIAEELLFPDQAALTRFFKGEKGESPSVYRKRIMDSSGLDMEDKEPELG